MMWYTISTARATVPWMWEAKECTGGHAVGCRYYSSKLAPKYMRNTTIEVRAIFLELFVFLIEKFRMAYAMSHICRCMATHRWVTAL